MPWVLLAVLVLLLWYIVAPRITPQSLRPKPQRPTAADNETKAQGQGRR